MHYCVRYHFRAFGDHWVSSSLIGAMCTPLHVLVVLLCSGCRACSCSLLLKGSRALSPPLLLYFLYKLIHYLLSTFSTNLPVQCGRGWGRVLLADRAHGWVASRVGSWVFWLFVFGVSSSSLSCSWAPNLHVQRRHQNVLRLT